MNSIKAVAGQWITDLFEDVNFELFKFNVPANEIVPDHNTGPRLIIFLNDLNATRLTGQDQINAQRHQVFYLTNDFSAGFNNGAESSAYLVLNFKCGEIEDITVSIRQKDSFQKLFSHGEVEVSINKKTQTVDFENSALIYLDESEQVKHVMAGDSLQVNEDAIIIKLPKV